MHKRASELQNKIHRDRKKKKRLKRLRTEDLSSLLLIKSLDFQFSKALIMLGIASVFCLNAILIPATLAQTKRTKHLPANQLSVKQLLASDIKSKEQIPALKNIFIIAAPKINLELDELSKKILPIIKKTPMEKMLPDISARKREVAAYMIGIGMKESKFGIYSPKKNGADCFNYWGYRGKENTTLSGYSCFNSPQHAVKIVGDRIESLINQGISNPKEMVVWKCGWTCGGHSPESVRKWISDVSIHYYRLNQEQLARK